VVLAARIGSTTGADRCERLTIRYAAMRCAYLPSCALGDEAIGILIA
jgi:hypothetical protein